MARNEADALIYQTEKLISESGQQLDSQTKSQVETLISELKQSLKQDQLSDIKKRTEELTHAVHSMSQTMYQKNDPQGGTRETGQGQTESSGKPSDDDVVDAEFSEVA